VFVFATPEGAHISDTITIVVKAYAWATPVDLDNLTGSVEIHDMRQIALSFQWQAPGVYNAAFLIPPDVDPRNSLGLSVTAANANGFGTTSQNYRVAKDPGWSPPGLQIHTRVANFDEVGYAPRPGSDIVFEARTFFDGVLDGRGTPDGVVTHSQGTGSVSEPLRGTTVRAGVYRYAFHIPGDLAGSAKYEFSARLAAYGSQPTGQYLLEVDPIPAVAILQDLSPQLARVRVCAAWGQSPLERAAVEVSAVVAGYGMGSPVFVRETNLTTGRLGCLDVSLEFVGDPGAFIRISANVSAFGKTTTLEMPAVPLSRASLGPPGPVGAGGVQVTRETDTTMLAPGGVANLSLLITLDGHPMANSSFATLVYRYDRGPPASAANLSTDGSGRLHLQYTIPDDWKSFDQLRVLLLSPSGDRIELATWLGPPPNLLNQQSRDAAFSVLATGDTPNHTVDFSTQYGGPVPISKAEVSVYVYPAETAGFSSIAIAGNFPVGTFDTTGVNSAGFIALPGWLVEGDYVVFVTIDKGGSSDALDFSWSLANWTFVHLTPRASTPVNASGPPPADHPAEPGAPGPLAPSETVADGASFWLIFLIAAATAALTVTKRWARGPHAR
jgi:hypothetical protein